MFNQVSGETFYSVFSDAIDTMRSNDVKGVDGLELYDIAKYIGVDCFLSEDKQTGYAIAYGDLVSVFSLVRGRGDALLVDAISNGAGTLDCFADLTGNVIGGQLFDLYSRHGFVIDESHNEAGEYPVTNGVSPVEGEPRVVVYMTR